MSELPLPEALIDAMAWEYAEWRQGPAMQQNAGPRRASHDNAMLFMPAALRAALAFRDESGHRAVWSAEEVAAIIEERDAAAEALGDARLQLSAIGIAPAERDYWCTEYHVLRGWLGRALNEGRNVLPDATDDQAAVIEAWARAALARVRGPEPLDPGWGSTAGDAQTIVRGPEPALPVERCPKLWQEQCVLPTGHAGQCERPQVVRLRDGRIAADLGHGPEGRVSE